MRLHVFLELQGENLFSQHMKQSASHLVGSISPYVSQPCATLHLSTVYLPDEKKVGLVSPDDAPCVDEGG